MPLCQSDQMALAVSLRTGAGRWAIQRGELRLEAISFASRGSREDGGSPIGRRHGEAREGWRATRLPAAACHR
jgi:hypothetical protein